MNEIASLSLYVFSAILLHLFSTACCIQDTGWAKNGEEAEHAVTENERPRYETENKKDLSRLLKVSIDLALRTTSGRLFQARRTGECEGALAELEPSAWNDEVAP